jgi:hypothetical protein
MNSKFILQNMQQHFDFFSSKNCETSNTTLISHIISHACDNNVYIPLVAYTTITTV